LRCSRPHSTAERQAGDTGVGDDADRADEPVRLRCVVELGEERPAAHAGSPPLGVDLRAAHPRKIDHDPVVARREARDAVATAPDRDDELLLPGETERRDDVFGARRPHDQRRPPVDHAVPDRTRRVIARVVGPYDLPGESPGQAPEIARSHRHILLLHEATTRESRRADSNPGPVPYE